MATYAIGDVQGCADELERLLAQAGFSSSRDCAWFVGDLVNRGPKSLDVLRLVRALGKSAIAVLGNHDFHLLRLADGLGKARAGDTLQAVLDAPQAGELIDWLRHRPLMHVAQGYAMVHAGLLPQWTIDKALALAREVEVALRGAGHRDFLRHLYGAEPRVWRDDLRGYDRPRVIVNAMARLRFCTPAGEIDLDAKGARAPAGYRPWFELRPAGEMPIVCGHWSAMGLKLAPQLLALDTGCVWGGRLSALRLEDRTLFQVPCRGYQAPEDA
ncbi:MAG: symmetrical bis(5'-nucleosyl)-tetraphosphatase [Burkholderiales bacterium]